MPQFQTYTRKERILELKRNCWKFYQRKPVTCMVAIALVICFIITLF